MSGVSLFALLGAMGLASAQTSINYTTKAIPLEKVVAELAKQSGEKLLISEQLSAQPVAVQVRTPTTPVENPPPTAPPLMALRK